jgi:hypothetical protein
MALAKFFSKNLNTSPIRRSREKRVAAMTTTDMTDTTADQELRALMAEELIGCRRSIGRRFCPASSSCPQLLAAFESPEIA